MAVQVPTNPVEIAEAVGKTAENFSGNDRKMFIGITIMFLICIVYLTWQFSADVKHQRWEFLQQIDKITERMMNSFDKNTQATWELRNTIDDIKK